MGDGGRRCGISCESKPFSHELVHHLAMLYPSVFIDKT